MLCREIPLSSPKNQLNVNHPPVDISRSFPANINYFFVEDTVLYYKSTPDSPRRICVPDDLDLRNAIFYESHNSATSSHTGYLKTLLALQSKFYWLRMDHSVRRYVASCEMCQLIKASHRKPAGLLHPLEVPSNRWANISMDFVTGLPHDCRSECDAILVIVDRLTKRPHFISTTTTSTADETARLFCDHYQKLHGLPFSIVSDRDSNLHLSSGLSSWLYRKRNFSSAPPFDWKLMTRRRKLTALICKCSHTDWNAKLSLAEFAYNSRVHSSIGLEPFVADLGYVPRSIIDFVVPTSRTARSQVLSFVQLRNVILQQCKDLLAESQATMKFFHDRNRPTYRFEEGDQLLLDTSNLDLHHVGTSGKRKLAPR
ncbi:Retrotransposon protein, Ty3-gypsy subclass [Phytophthora megakarya]|uniref:Retrotransposon protein, Ty3-gypsy subclass n=1 Tax=Phytophthora megakarya TaxID=4795 RepID=A0A225WV89_9STRA|nr:Retrotransposon protein, Ty3-gypsy subclass [Phytophthora megakarya]